MRVIAGSARRIQLNTVEGLGTRPTTDRIKETLFNMISNDIYDSNFLDLYSGSGAIGIEALSRGARAATFVEQQKDAVACIKSNLAATKLTDHASVYASDVMSALHNLDLKNESFDMIFMDPPYNQDYEKEVLGFLSKSRIINEDTVIIVESSLQTSFAYLEQYGLVSYKIKEYKTNKHVFIRKMDKGELS